MARRMFYVEMSRGGRAVIEGEAASHLRKVLRAERGQKYEVSDNESLFLAEIADFSKDRVEFEILDKLAAPVQPARFHLLPSLVKFDRFEWILEKATELGVERITPVVAGRTDAGLGEGARKRSERWRRILFESGQQARRVTRPELEEVTEFEAAIHIQGDARFWLEESRDAPPILGAMPKQPAPGNVVCLLVGPEGGWEETERREGIEEGWTSVSLGNLILRAETAAIASLAVLSAVWRQGVLTQSA